MQNLKLQYYLSDSISRVVPGKADFVTVQDKDGKKVKLQKRHLVMTVGEFYQSSVRIIRSVLLGFQCASLGPKNCLLTSDMPHKVCGYKYHNHIILFLQNLHQKFPALLHSSEFMLVVLPVSRIHGLMKLVQLLSVA